MQNLKLSILMLPKASSTQLQLATQLSVTNKAVSKWENGVSQTKG